MPIYPIPLPGDVDQVAPLNEGIVPSALLEYTLKADLEYIHDWAHGPLAAMVISWVFYIYQAQREYKSIHPEYEMPSFEQMFHTALIWAVG